MPVIYIFKLPPLDADGVSAADLSLTCGEDE